MGYNQSMPINDIVILDLWMIFPLFLAGSLLHFTYHWSKNNKLVAVFSAVNESYWEHFKIAFWPILLLAVVEFTLGGYKYPSFIPVKTISLYSIPVSITTLVFTYKYFTKKNILVIDMFCFLAAIGVAQIISSLLLLQLDADLWTVIVSLFFLLAITTSFTIFSLRPPKETDFFQDPISKKYGTRTHK